MKIYLTFLILVFSWNFSMAGVYMSTATLYKLLSDQVSSQFAYGYIIGIKEANSSSGAYCIPDRTSIDEIVSTVMNGLLKSPNSAYAESVQAGVVITLFFSEKYPCGSVK